MEELRRLRQEAGLSQAQLARDSGVDRATINKIEQGKRSPSMATLESLARAMNTEVGDFFPKGQAPLPLSLDEAEAQRRLSRASLEYLSARAEKHDAEVRDPNSPHFANATAAALWLAGVEDELASWTDWAGDLPMTLPEDLDLAAPAAGSGFGAAASFVGRLFIEALGPILKFQLVTKRAEQRIEAMNAAPDVLAARRLEAATAAAAAGIKRMENRREAASG